MCKLILDRGGFADFTSVSNIFIDEYMPKANGEFIKIYMHLLRVAGSGDCDLSQCLSTEKMADRFNMLESDVIRALNYWSSQGLLSLTFSEENELTGIKLESAISNRYFVKGILQTGTDAVQVEETKMLAKVSGESFSTPAPTSSGIMIPPKKRYSKKEIAAFSDNDSISQLTFLAQTYLGKTLNTSDIGSILYMVDGLQLSAEFIEYIMETCISLGHKSLSSIEKQAVIYVQKGISSIEDAKADEKLRRAVFKSVYDVFGLAPKVPVKRDISYITKWADEYGFSDEIIIEACNRTMARTHTGSFEYTDSILSNWYKHGAKSLDEIARLDEEHSEEFKKSLPKKVSSVRSKKAKSFEQRSYDYNALEKQLNASQNKKIKALLAEQKHD